MLMRNFPARSFAAGLLLFWFAATSAPAEVTALEIAERSAVLDGAVFGKVGPYERIVGTARFALNPRATANHAIRDLSLAETKTAGEVVFSATFYVLRPRNASQGNGTLLLEVSNRGGKGMLSRFCLARSAADPREREHFGDAWLFEEGYTVAWVGWQWDVPANAPLRLEPARLRDTAAPGLVRAEFIPDADGPKMPLGDRNHQPIPLAEGLHLAVRDHPETEPTAIPRSQWQLVDGNEAVLLAGGFKAGLLYEFVYRGRAGVVSGLGLAAVRDFVAFAKHGGAAAAPLGRPRHALSFGISQSGRFLRHFLHEGFNADEQGRAVFDGVWADVAGAGRGSFNHRYAQASRDGNPWTNVFYPTDVFPFHDLETSDPVDRRTGGLLDAATRARVVPKIFYTNSSYEYWGRAAALIHTTPDGRADFAPAPDTRIYAIAGAQHGPGSSPPVPRHSRFAALPTDQRPLQRALLAALQRWVAAGIAPPDSVYPRISDGTLVPPGDLGLPPLAGLVPPEFPRLARRLDFGADFERTGVVTADRIASRGSFPLRVPAVDADGTDRTGIRLPVVAVPLGTHAGWNFRTAGAPGHLVNFLGSFLPFAKTEAERRASGDPRASLAERYRHREDYLGRATTAADQLVAQRLLLPRDRDLAVTHCAQLWDAVVK